MASRGPYNDLSKAWGSKEKKQDSRAKKSTLKRLTEEEVEEFMSITRDDYDVAKLWKERGELKLQIEKLRALVTKALGWVPDCECDVKSGCHASKLRAEAKELGIEVSAG